MELAPKRSGRRCGSGTSCDYASKVFALPPTRPTRGTSMRGLISPTTLPFLWPGSHLNSLVKVTTSFRGQDIAS